jgi:uncharacterized HAD superfamily protein
MPALCVDIDNVIAQSDVVMRAVIRKYTRGWVNLRYEDIVEFDYHRCRDADGCAITVDEWREIHQIFSRPRHLATVQPVDRVQEHLRRLLVKYDIHIATTRLPRARRATIRWLEKHAIPAHDLHFLKSGQKHASLGIFAAAIEDHYEQAVAFADAGTPCYLLRHPWNRDKPAKPTVYWVDGWDELTACLLGQAPPRTPAIASGE